jgi:hypothetical protein
MWMIQLSPLFEDGKSLLRVNAIGFVDEFSLSLFEYEIG